MNQTKTPTPLGMQNKKIRRLGIIQPGRIGDIIICLPIALHYYKLGYEVLWPVADYIYREVMAYAPYVTFVPVASLDCAVPRQIVNEHCNTILDLTISFPNGSPHNDRMFAQYRDSMTFDTLKYNIANVDVYEKYNLVLERKLDKEEELFKMLRLPDGKPYTVVHLDGSNESIQYLPGSNERVIPIQPLPGYTVFDWITTLQRASRVLCLDSCVANLVNQLGLHINARALVTRSADVRPAYVADWKVIKDYGEIVESDLVWKH